jgi:hypothetical protein
MAKIMHWKGTEVLYFTHVPRSHQTISIWSPVWILVSNGYSELFVYGCLKMPVSYQISIATITTACTTVKSWCLVCKNMTISDTCLCNLCEQQCTVIREMQMTMILLLQVILCFVFPPCVEASNKITVNFGASFDKVRCEIDNKVQCALGQPIESHHDVSLGQCNLACKRIPGCKWFNYFDSKSSTPACKRRLCQLFNHPPQNNVQQGCSLYAVSFWNVISTKSSDNELKTYHEI